MLSVILVDGNSLARRIENVLSNRGVAYSRCGSTPPSPCEPPLPKSHSGASASAKALAGELWLGLRVVWHRNRRVVGCTLALGISFGAQDYVSQCVGATKVMMGLCPLGMHMCRSRIAWRAQTSNLLVHYVLENCKVAALILLLDRNDIPMSIFRVAFGEEPKIRSPPRIKRSSKDFEAKKTS